MNKVNFSELDFQKLKDSLKDFLKSQNKFTDYDFEGAGINFLLDLLVYNTQYNGYYLNMAVNESFLDSAQLRNNVVSKAKVLGYTPNSITSAKAKINIQIFPDDSPSSVFVSENTQFYTLIDNKRFTFYPSEAFFVYRSFSGNYITENVEIIEGKRFTHKWTYDSSQPIKQKFIIPNSNVDINTIKVSVQTSSQNSTIETFVKYEDINELDSSSSVFFIQEVEDKKYEVYFGDGIIGKGLIDGNIVNISYLVSSGDVVYGAKTFYIDNSIGGYSTTLTTVENAGKAIEAESIDSIKFLAPRNYQAQNRAVTKNDFEAFIKKDIASIEYARVWGGEDNIPPEYGRIYISVKPYTGLSLSEDQKADIINTYIKPKSIISLETILVEPEYSYIIPTIEVFYDSKKTSLSKSDLELKILDSIETFKTTYLSGFDTSFRFSKFTNSIDETDSSIVSNIITLKLKYELLPRIDLPTKYIIEFNNALNRGDSANKNYAISSDVFVYKGLETYLGDDGKGNLILYRLSANDKVTIETNVGTIDYNTGKVVINSLEIQSIPSQEDTISIVVTPIKNDIVSVRNQIILLEESDINLSVKDIN